MSKFRFFYNIPGGEKISLYLDSDSEFKFYNDKGQELELRVKNFEDDHNHDDHGHSHGHSHDDHDEHDEHSEGFKEIPQKYIDKYKDYHIVTKIPALKNAKKGDTVTFKLSIPKPGGTFAGSYTLPKDCTLDPDDWEWEVVDLVLPILPINKKYGRTHLISSLNTAFDWISEVVELDTGVKLKLDILNNGDYEPEVRDVSYANNVPVSDTIGDLLFVTTDIQDQSAECPRMNNMLAYAHAWSADTKVGHVSDKGMSLQFDKDDDIYIDSDPRLQVGNSFSLVSVLVHELIHIFFKGDHSDDADSIMHWLIDVNKRSGQLYPNRLLDQYEIRVIIKVLFGLI